MRKRPALGNDAETGLEMILGFQGGAATKISTVSIGAKQNISRERGAIAEKAMALALGKWFEVDLAAPIFGPWPDPNLAAAAALQ